MASPNNVGLQGLVNSVVSNVNEGFSIASDAVAKSIASGKHEVIGYNPTLAMKSLSTFKNTMESVLRRLSDAYNNLMEELKVSWASTKAVRFSNECLSFINIIQEGEKDANSILSSAILSVAQMASSAGDSFQFSAEIMVTKPKEISLDDNIDGYKGINLTKAKNAIMVFNTQVNNALAELSTLNGGLDVYDTHGEIQTLYQDRIEKLRANINNETNKINDKVYKTIEDHENAINLKRKQIVSRFSSSSPILSE